MYLHRASSSYVGKQEVAPAIIHRSTWEDDGQTNWIKIYSIRLSVNKQHQQHRRQPLGTALDGQTQG
jgi:hypothetical protein